MFNIYQKDMFIMQFISVILGRYLRVVTELPARETVIIDFGFFFTNRGDFTLANKSPCATVNLTKPMCGTTYKINLHAGEKCSNRNKVRKADI